MFDVVVEESEAAGRQLWTIGVDNDQWFQVDRDQQGHMLTSIIKRGDVAAFELVRAMLETDERVVLRLGVADEVWQYSQQGDGLTPEMIAVLDQIIDDIEAGRIEIPLAPDRAGPAARSAKATRSTARRTSPTIIRAGCRRTRQSDRAGHHRDHGARHTVDAHLRRRLACHR